MRKLGGNITKVTEVGNAIFRDPDIIECRIRIHNLYERINVIHQLISNEAKFALLAYGVLERTIPGENKEKWIALCDQIQNNIRAFREEIKESLTPELESNRLVLSKLMDDKLAAAESHTVEALHEDIKVCREQIGSIMDRTGRTANKCERLLSEISSVSDVVDKTVTKNHAKTFKVMEINSSLLPLLEMGNNNSLISGRAGPWARILIDIAQAKMRPTDTRREMQHYLKFMNLCCNDSLQTDIIATIPSIFDKNINKTKGSIDWPSQFKCIKLIDEFFPGHNLIAKCYSTLKSVNWALEINLITQSSDLSKIEKIAGIKAIHQHLQATCTQDDYNAILKNIGVEFVISCQNTQSNVNWKERRNTIQMLINEFVPADPEMSPGKNIGLEFQAACGFMKLEESGRDLLGDHAQLAFACSANPLHLVKYEPDMINAVTVDKETFQTNFDSWLAVTRTLLGVPMDTTKPDKSLDIKKIEQLVILTFCRNLGITDMRYADMDVLRNICRTYLNSTNDIKGGVAFKLNDNDSLEKRLNYLAIHLCSLITSLKPLATPYNTGHVRIMEMYAAQDLTKGRAADLCIVRTSSTSPTTLTKSIVQNPFHVKLLGDATKAPDSTMTAHETKGVSITMSDGAEYKINSCYSFNYRKQGFLYEHSLPDLVLAPFSQLLQAERQMQQEHQRDVGVIKHGYNIPLNFSDSGDIDSVNINENPAAVMPATIARNDNNVVAGNNNNAPASEVARNPLSLFHHSNPSNDSSKLGQDKLPGFKK